MLIRRMTAVFGKLQGETLELQNGFNIIQAPNETGKSTWCAFLLAMLYGINSRERDKAGSLADKNRYAPWSGAAMSGRLELEANGRAITLLRNTRRAGAPMGEFQALYTDTADSVPGLTAALCGEQLLGVTREVYARSAFIRQNNLSITQNAELERRIAALISSGEEGTSYSEAADTLKRQLNRRRHNKTGQIPALETELQQLRQQLTEADALSSHIAQLRRQEQLLTRQETDLRRELEQHALWVEKQQAYRLSTSAIAADEALRRADALRRQLEADHIPENETIARLRGAIVNINTSHQALEKARESRDEAMQALLKAEAAANRSPFAGQTAAQAKKFVDDTVAPLEPAGEDLIWQVILGALLITLSAFLLTVGNAPSAWLEVKYLGIPAGLFAIIHPFYKRRKRKRTLQAILKRHGVSSVRELQALAADYAQLLTARDEAQTESDRCSVAADTLYNSISANEQAILLEIRRFAPLAHDLSTADVLLRGCAIRRKELAAAEAAAREALFQQEAAQKHAQAEMDSLSAPGRARAEADAELAQTTAALNSCRGAIQHLMGQLSALGDTSQLAAEIESAQGRLDALQEEYDALQLALNALDTANQSLQNRFAPALGRRTAQLFDQMTGGQYRSVVLDRSFRLAAEPAGDHIYRDVSLLSAGAADQLYLAARLAICESVLPAEKNVPIILDDALTNFDDQRCAAALRLLKELAKERQILLFTCHSREAAFFAGDREVMIHQLTNGAKKV